MSVTDDVAYQIVLPALVVRQNRRRTRRVETVDQNHRAAVGHFGQDDFAVRFGYIQNAFRAVFHKRPDQRVDLLVAVVRIRNHQRFARFADFLLDAFD